MTEKMTDREATSAKNRKPGGKTFAWLIISQVIMLFSSIPWLAIAGLSFMAFDSGVTPQATLFVSMVWSYPVVCILCAMLGWMLFRRGKYASAAAVTSVPLLPTLFALGVMIFYR